MVKVNQPPPPPPPPPPQEKKQKKTIGILTKVFHTYGPNLVILAWTGDELSRGQAGGWRTHGHTHIRRQRQYLKAKTSLGYSISFCFAVLCCGYTLTDFPISIRLTSLALWQSNDCPSASKATLMNMDKYFMWIHYERLHNHNKAKHNKTVCIFLGIDCKNVKLFNFWRSLSKYMKQLSEIWLHSLRGFCRKEIHDEKLWSFHQFMMCILYQQTKAIS